MHVTHVHFLRVPRTASSSLDSLLRGALGVEATSRATTWSSLTWDELQRLPHLPYSSGHFGARVLEVLGPGTRWLTVLRRPLDQVASSFAYARQLAHEPRASEADRALGRRCEALGSVRAALDDPSTAQHLTNSATRLLADEFGPQASDRRDEASWEAYRARIQGVLGPIGGATLERALARLAAADAVGVFERLDDLVASLGARLGIDTVAPLPHLRPTHSSGVRSGDDRRAIEAASAYDLVLHARAEELAAEQYRAAAHEALRWLVGWRRAVDDDIEPLATATDESFVEGWHPPEEAGRRFRWMRDPQATIVLRLDRRRSHDVRVEVVDELVRGSTDDARLLVDGVVITPTVRAADDGSAVLEAVIPPVARAAAGPWTTVTLAISDVTSPAALGRSEDPRTLGLAIGEFTATRR